MIRRRPALERRPGVHTDEAGKGGNRATTFTPPAAMNTPAVEEPGSGDIIDVAPDSAKKVPYVHRLLLLPLLVITVVLAACSGPTQTQAPATGATPVPRNIAETPAPPANTLEPEETTPTPKPAPTPTAEPSPITAPKATPEPPPTPEPTSTPSSMAEGETPGGVLSPLSLHDAEDVNYELSEAELACLKEGSPGLHLGWAFILPGYGDPQQRVEIIGCLEDETLARIHLADIVEGVAILSPETSGCVRAAFRVIDPRSMMLAKVEGFPEDTLNSATTLSLVTMACLNDAEWETTAEWVREDPELREVMQCMMEKLGGPGEMAAAMTVEDEEHQKALAEVAAACAEETRPVPDGAPAAPAEKPEPASTPEPASIAPLDPDDPAELLSRLSPEERDCITDSDLLADFWSHPSHVDYEDVAQQMGCLEDETLLDLHLAQLAWYFQDLGGTLRADTAACIRESLDGISMGDLIREAHTAKPSIVRQMHSAVWDLTVFYCLSEEEAALAAPDSGITDEEYDGMICTVDAFGGLEEFTEAYRNTGAEEFTEIFLANLSGCHGG